MPRPLRTAYWVPRIPRGMTVRGRSILCYILFCQRDIRPVDVRARERGEFFVIGGGFGSVAELVGGLGGAGVSVEAVGLLLEGCLEGGERLLGISAIEQHRAIELARGRERAGRHRRLLGLVLGVGGSAHGGECIVIFAFGMERPGGRDLALD